MLDEESYISKVQNLSGKHGRKCGGHKREGKCALPGEVCMLAARLPSSKEDGMSVQKSAEGKVIPSFGTKA